ncbi:hypothetical protein BS78_01G333600 [Paspalum vaginatum]|nr:hypothetical protein BS78_01G333600 [Paspalum vaginatum]
MISHRGSCRRHRHGGQPDRDSARAQIPARRGGISVNARPIRVHTARLPCCLPAAPPARSLLRISSRASQHARPATASPPPPTPRRERTPLLAVQCSSGTSSPLRPRPGCRRRSLATLDLVILVGEQAEELET